MVVIMNLVVIICIRATKSLSLLSTQGTTAVKDSCGELKGEMKTGLYDDDHDYSDDERND